MSEKFAKIVIYTAAVIAVIIGIALTVIGGIIEGWIGVGIIFSGQILFIAMLYLYNRRYK